jgi:hypothetical protein
MNYQLTEDERKQVDLMKCWAKISCGSNSKAPNNAFVEDWTKLQKMFVNRLGLLGARCYINHVEKEMESYILNLSN